MECDMCAGFIFDWCKRPMRPDNILFKDIHHGRLARAMDEITPIFVRFMQEVLCIHLEMGLLMIKYDFQEDGEKGRWESLTLWFEMSDSNVFEEIKLLLQEHCVFKDKSLRFCNIWIGFCITNLACVKGIHSEHLKGRRDLMHILCPGVSKPMSMPLPLPLGQAASMQDDSQYLYDELYN
jgi:hypothetical protein